MIPSFRFVACEQVNEAVAAWLRHKRKRPPLHARTINLGIHFFFFIRLYLSDPRGSLTSCYVPCCPSRRPSAAGQLANWAARRPACPSVRPSSFRPVKASVMPDLLAARLSVHPSVHPLVPVPLAASTVSTVSLTDLTCDFHPNLLISLSVYGPIFFFFGLNRFFLNGVKIGASSVRVCVSRHS